MAKITKDGVACYAHPMTVGQFNRMEEKGLDAFKTAPLSERAKKEGAFSSWGVGVCLTPTVCEIPRGDVASFGPLYVDFDGELDNFVDHSKEAGLRVSLHPIYKSNSKIVKTAHMQVRTDRIWNKGKRDTEEVTSVGKVVTVGGIEYLWLNEDECLNGTERDMDLVSVEHVARADHPSQLFARGDDYFKETKLHQQCEKVALENCDQEELSLLQEGMLSKQDEFENWTPLAIQKEKPKSIKEVYQFIEEGKLTSEEGKQALRELLIEVQLTGGNDEIKEFTQDLEAEHEAYLQRHSEEAKDSYIAAKDTIDGLKF